MLSDTFPTMDATLSNRIEHALLRADATRQEVEALCAQAWQHQLRSVWVNGSRVELARHLLEDKPTLVVAAVGFPLGAMDPDAKRFETEAAVDAGANELNVVLNLGWLRDGADRQVLRELRDIVEAADDLPVNVIIESPLLSAEEQVRACRLVVEAEAQSVMLSAGLLPPAPTPDDVRLIRQVVGAGFGLAVAGGIRDAAAARTFLDAGADRIAVHFGEFPLA